MKDMPNPEMAYKPQMKVEQDINFEISSRRPTVPMNEIEKPKKALRGINKGKLNHALLTKNILIEFPATEREWTFKIWAFSLYSCENFSQIIL